MGIYLNPGPAMLRQGRRSKVYVDKSAMISYLDSVLNTEQKYVCVSRPRRFGKTMAANMVCAYYDRTVDGAAEFAGLDIAADPGFDEHRNRYDVLHVNVSQFYYGARRDLEKAISDLLRSVVWDLRCAHPDVPLSDEADLRKCLGEVFARTGVPFVVVVDSWDCPIRLKASEDEQSRYLEFLSHWLSDSPWLALCYMTGVLPIKRYGSHSALGMFVEFGMTSPRQMAPYMGLTEDEVRALCGEWGQDLDECRALYGGYRFEGVDGVLVEAYSPISVAGSMTSGNLRNYWNETETYEALKCYLDLGIVGLRERVACLVAGGRVAIDTETCANDMTTFNSADDVLTLLVHLGYLAYDAAAGEAYVPNREVMGAFEASTRNPGTRAGSIVAA